MMLFDAEGHIKRYDSPEDILREFFDLRLTFYEKRRVGMLQVSTVARLYICSDAEQPSACARKGRADASCLLHAPSSSFAAVWAYLHCCAATPWRACHPR
jgi:hypothetical protein